MEEMREKIDEVDNKILELLNQRAEHVHKVGSWKKENLKKVYDESREDKIIARLQNMNEGMLCNDSVENVIRISKPFKQASIESQKQRTKIKLPQGLIIGGDNFFVMAGPCSVESEDQTVRIAQAIKKRGATVLRGGAFKPRSSPYAFQGLEEEGLKILKLAREETGLPIITELMDIKHLEMVLKYSDIIQVGARNMQNFNLLKELGKIDMPVMLKRGPSATIDEWLMSAEYILSGGNPKVILCERGIRSFDNEYSRNTMDLNAIPILKNITHLPIVADSLIVEVHDQPDQALSDGSQALLPEDFEKLMADLHSLSKACGVNLQTKFKDD